MTSTIVVAQVGGLELALKRFKQDSAEILGQLRRRRQFVSVRQRRRWKAALALKRQRSRGRRKR